MPWSEGQSTVTDISGSASGVNVLDEATATALRDAVQSAKNSGWTQADFNTWFGERDITVLMYLDAIKGLPFEDPTGERRAVFAQLSITGLPAHPPAKRPNLDAIKAHINWLIETARGAYDDALIEIAHDDTEGGSPRAARLFSFDEIEDAAAYAMRTNLERKNVYIGAGLRLPDTKRQGRCSEADFYVATAVPVDIDTRYDEVRAKMASVVDDGLVVTTGLTPDRRSQHWTRLAEPCDEASDFGHAFAALVQNVGADFKVKDAARIMRLGGTLTWPGEKKIAKGYVTELTTVTVRAEARASNIDALKALEPSAAPLEGEGSFRRASDGAGVERDPSGRVINGRETYWRDLLLAKLSTWQAETGSDPSEVDLWNEAWPEFSDPEKVDNEDRRWTSEFGQKELGHRLRNTMRRLRSGFLARHGIYSIETGVNQEQAEEAARLREKKGAIREALERPFDDPPMISAIAVREPPVGEDASTGLRLSDWTADRYEGDAEPIEWLCEGTIPTATPMLLAAPGGIGKSFMALDLCLEIAAPGMIGRKFFGGDVVRHGTAVFLTAEDSQKSVHRRLESIDPHRRRSRDPGKLIVAPLPDAGGPIPFVISDGKRLELTKEFHSIREQLRAIPDLRLVVIDPLQAFVMADVNADPAAGQYMWSALATICAQTSATVILLHHMRKDGSQKVETADDARHAIRGSTALVDGARLAYALWKPSDDHARTACALLDAAHDSGAIVMGAVVKANEQADLTVRTFHRQPGGVLHDVTDIVEDGARAGNSLPSMAVCHDILREIGTAFDEASEGRGEGYGRTPNCGTRYAANLIKNRSGCTFPDARRLLEGWLQNGHLRVEEYNKKLHKTALKLISVPA